MTRDDRLARTLRRQAESLRDERPLTLDRVKGRARSIRRRRYAAAGVAGVAVLAVAVPAAAGPTGLLDRSSTPVASRTGTPLPLTSQSPSEPSGPPTPTKTSTPHHSSPPPSPTLSPSHTSTPSTVRQVVLTTNVARGSHEPGIAYLVDGAIVRPDGSTVPVQAEYDGLAPLGDGWVVTGQDTSARFTAFLDASGQETSRAPGTGVLAVSPDGTLVSYATAGELRVVWNGGETTLSDPGQGAMSPVVVTGSQRCDNPEGVGGCMVFYDVDGASGSTSYSSSRHGIVQATGFIRFADESVDYLDAGMVAHGQQGTCWAVRSPRGAELWHTCDYRLLRFSPDGRYLLAEPTEPVDGVNYRSLTVLDARTGRAVVTYAPEPGAEVFVHQAVWDTDGTVLATVWDTDHWSLMRLSPDGVLSNVSKGGLAGGTDPSVVPLHLPARP